MHTHPQSIAEATKTEAKNSFEEDHPHEATSEQRRFRKGKERTRKQQAEPNAIESFHLRLTHAHVRTRTHAPIQTSPQTETTPKFTDLYYPFKQHDCIPYSVLY